MKAVVVAGTRPNFIKVASLMRELGRRPGIGAVLIHTGQHYDRAMSQSFFEDLEIPRPHLELGVGSGTHAEQTAAVMVRMEEILAESRPDLVVVVGDVNSTLASALAAVKLGLEVAHVEAGLRSFDRSMPEEINRLLTDAISSLHFVTERSGRENLIREGIPSERIHLVGNVMIDTLFRHREKSRSSPILLRLGLQAAEGAAPEEYAVLTLHRPANVDDPVVLGGILQAVSRIAREIPVVFPCHPRTRKRLSELPGSPAGRREGKNGIIFHDPLGYLDFLRLMSEASVVLSDSGGIQEETTALGIPCLTLRENTERPITVEEGTNRIVGVDPRRIEAAFQEARGRKAGPRPLPERWDGRAAERIADILEDVYGPGREGA